MVNLLTATDLPQIVSRRTMTELQNKRLKVSSGSAADQNKGEDSEVSPHTEDRDHLQGVSPQLAAQADMLLCVTQGSHTVELPVHKTILTAHSPVLSDAIESTLGSKAPQDSLPRLPLYGNDILAVHSALAHIYQGYILPDESAQVKSLLPVISFKDLPVYIKHMSFFDKYSMTIVAQTQLESLMPILRRCLQARQLNSADAATVLECAASAQNSKLAKLVPMVALCDAIIIRRFSVFACQQELMTSKLFTTSMLSIARGLSSLHEQSLLDMQPWHLSMQSYKCKTCRSGLIDRYSRPFHGDKLPQSIALITTEVAIMHNISAEALGL